MNKAQRIVLIVGALLIALTPIVSNGIELNSDRQPRTIVSFSVEYGKSINEFNYKSDLAHRHFELVYLANILAVTVLLFYAMKDINLKMKK